MGEIAGYYVMPHPPIIIPEIGKGEEKKGQRTIEACKRVAEEIKELKPEVIIIITPHGPVFRDAIALLNVPVLKGDFKHFGCPQIKFNTNINMHLTDNIIRYADSENITVVPITDNSLKEYNIIPEMDHGAMVPLYHINKEYTDYELVHITYGILSKTDLYKFGMMIQRAVKDSEYKAVIIASGDLSHRLSEDGPYEYSPAGREFDRKIIELLQSGDVREIFTLDKNLVESAGECGLRSFYIMLGSMDGKDIKGTLLSYEGPYGVGYGVLKFDTEENPENKFLKVLEEAKKNEVAARREKEDAYTKLARETLEYFVKNENYLPLPSYITEEMLREKRGVFVSIKKDGELRGCIGTIEPDADNLALEIMRNAIEAGENDPRFPGIGEEELEDLEYSVDVLMSPEKTDKKSLDPKKYGVIVKKGNRAGLLLPDLEGVNTVDEQIRIALNKGDIGENEDYSLERFEVVRHR